ncbi:hypothetical protein H4W33_010858 [Kibdelosporangium phytohabitans]|uniref:Uncharacterized protein n=2 Tax=Kibdelosporangium phytohabitans TaxID=860235 RepID=A0A0N9HRB1_9PSEU|nr:hypothetical protein [Kibdelosporangium phytohabitans]ALG07347.1 hypothetical protein AOZ06_10795 [Kibdelosporangium phytohabitans]MBE1471784.1 hypothetical protein [Kibdelosporangium phytohabitans]
MWLAGQVFLLCLVSFLAGAGIMFLAVRGRKPEPVPAEPESTPDPDEETEVPEPVVIRASKKSMRYHTPDSPHYDRVSSSLTFISAADAELAGFQAWDADKATARTAGPTT